MKSRWKFQILISDWLIENNRKDSRSEMEASNVPQDLETWLATFLSVLTPGGNFLPMFSDFLEILEIY